MKKKKRYSNCFNVDEIRAHLRTFFFCQKVMKNLKVFFMFSGNYIKLTHKSTFFIHRLIENSNNWNKKTVKDKVSLNEMLFELNDGPWPSEAITYQAYDCFLICIFTNFEYERMN